MEHTLVLGLGTRSRPVFPSQQARAGEGRSSDWLAQARISQSSNVFSVILDTMGNSINGFWGSLPHPALMIRSRIMADRLRITIPSSTGKPLTCSFGSFVLPRISDLTTVFSSGRPQSLPDLLAPVNVITTYKSRQ